MYLYCDIVPQQLSNIPCLFLPSLAIAAKHERLYPATVVRYSRNTGINLYKICFATVAKQLRTVVRPNQTALNLRQTGSGI